MLIQESIKVIVISLISPQMMPRSTTLRHAPRREAVRLCVRGIISALYGTIVLLF